MLYQFPFDSYVFSFCANFQLLFLWCILSVENLFKKIFKLFKHYARLSNQTLDLCSVILSLRTENTNLHQRLFRSIWYVVSSGCMLVITLTKKIEFWCLESHTTKISNCNHKDDLNFLGEFKFWTQFIFQRNPSWLRISTLGR